MTETIEISAERALSFFSQHLVGLHFKTDAPGKAGVKSCDGKRVIMLSATVLSFDGRWVLLTAGHIVRDLNAIIEGGHKLTNGLLVDTWNHGSISKEPYPFVYPSPEMTLAFDTPDGVDFGLIYLNSNAVANLAANGICPIDEVHWKARPDGIEHIFLLGIPSDGDRIVRAGGRESFICSPAIVHLDERSPIPDKCIKEAPLFYSTIPMPEPTAPLAIPTDFDCDGFSGGPIIGIKSEANGQIRYWVLAVQSAWYPGARVIVGVPVALIGGIIEGFVARMKKESGMSK